MSGLLSFLLQCGVSISVQLLTKLGLVSWAQALAIKVGTEVVEDVSEIKTYPEDGYPKGKGGV